MLALAHADVLVAQAVHVTEIFLVAGSQSKSVLAVPALPFTSVHLELFGNDPKL